MAFVNKTSIRSEFDSLKQQFNELNANGKVPAEAQILFRSFLVLFELLISVFMEKKTTKNSKNSSLPPSQTKKKDDTSTNKKTNGKGRPQNNDQYPGVKTTTETQVAEVNFCTHCGEDLSDTPCCDKERRTLIDIFFEKKVLHIDAEIKDCPYCEEQTKGWFPSNMSGPLQYGSGIKVFAMNLMVGQMVAINRVQKMIQALIGKAISEATLLRYMLKLNYALESWEADQIDILLSSKSLHSDETSMRVNKKNYWIHVYSSGDTTLKFIHPKRGCEAIDDIGIIPRYGGVVIHDCWASYLSYGNCDHGLCGSHLLRELKFIEQSNGYKWATSMKKLLKETAKKVAKSKRKKLTENNYKLLQKNFRTILTKGEKELPEIVKKKKTRGKVAKSDAHNLWERLKKYESSVLLFAKLPYVSFTNNRAEQDLRMNKVKQKVSGSFRQEIYAKAYCRISSYLKTKANQGTNSIIALHEIWAKVDAEKRGE